MMSLNSDNPFVTSSPLGIAFTVSLYAAKPTIALVGTSISLVTPLFVRTTLNNSVTNVNFSFSKGRFKGALYSN
jgi:hypothetical protein